MNSEGSLIQKIKTKHIIKNRETSNVVSQLELAALLATRADQIATGSRPYITVPQGMTDTKDIAILELKQRKCPLKCERIVRTSENDIWVEIWDPKEMVIPWSDTPFNM